MGKEIILYGAGKRGREIYSYLVEKGFGEYVYGFCDEDAETIKEVQGKKVWLPEELESHRFIYCVTSLDEQVQREKGNRIKNEKIIDFFDLADEFGINKEKFNRDFCAFYHMSFLHEFYNSVEMSEGIVCYGTGKRLKRFGECFKENGVLDKVKFCVDRNSGLHGRTIEIQGRKWDIYGIDKIKEIHDKNMLLLITNAQYEEIVDELSANSAFEGVEYYCLSPLIAEIEEQHAMQKEIPEDCFREEEQVIPKKIHYCWFGRNPIPEKYQKWMESWKKYCPDYEIIEWNEDNYDVTQNEYMYEAYKNKKWGFVPDYARLDIIYKHGGIYLDTDVELVQGLDDLLYQKGFAGFESEDAVALGLGFGAVAGLEIIAKMRDEYNEKHFVNATGELNLVASPVLQTECLKKYGLELNGEYQVVEGLTIYPEKMLSGKSIYTRRVKLKDYTRAIHHYDGSWLDAKDKKHIEKFESEMNGQRELKMHGIL